MAVTVPDLVKRGLSRRQADHWTRRGWLVPAARGSESGHRRVYPESELQVALVMHRLVAAGVTPEAAHRAARSDGWLSPEVRVLLVEPAEVAA